MIESIKNWDEKAFIWLNSFHSDGLDPIVFQLTQTITWIPLYLLLLYLIYRKDPKNTAWVIGGVMLTILLADQVSSGLMKPYFERLRPVMIHNGKDSFTTMVGAVVFMGLFLLMLPTPLGWPHF